MMPFGGKREVMVFTGAEKKGYTRGLNVPMSGQWEERYMGPGRTKEEQQPLRA